MKTLWLRVSNGRINEREGGNVTTADRAERWAPVLKETARRIPTEAGRRAWLHALETEDGFWGPMLAADAHARPALRAWLRSASPDRVQVLDAAAGLLHLRRGTPDEPTYAGLPGPDKGLALRIAQRELLGTSIKGTHLNSRLQREVVWSLAGRLHALTGRRPTYTATSSSGGPDVRLLRAALAWCWWPAPIASPARVIDWLNEWRKKHPELSRATTRLSTPT
jgi:hypothetical protein